MVPRSGKMQNYELSCKIEGFSVDKFRKYLENYLEIVSIIIKRFKDRHIDLIFL
jgi:hypothetical protein